MDVADRTRLASTLRLKATLLEAQNLWTARVASIAGSTALLSWIASPSYVLTFGAVRLSFYAALHLVARRRLNGGLPSQIVTSRLVMLIRLLMGLHLCVIALDLAIGQNLTFVGLLLLLGYTVVTAHQAQPDRRSYVVALSPPLAGLIALAGATPGASATNVVAVGLFLFTVLLTAVRRTLTNRRLVDAKAEALIAQEQLQRRIAHAVVAEEVALMGSWRIQLPQRSQTWSPGVFRIFGLPFSASPPSVEEVIAYYRPGDREIVAELVEASLSERRGFEFEHAIERADGASRILQLRAHFAEEGEGRGALYGVVQDVTDARQAYAALTASEAKYRLVTEHSTDMIATMAIDSTIEFVSPACVQILGYTPEELIGQKTLSLTHPDDRAAVIAHFEHLIAAGPGRSSGPYTFRARCKDDRYVWLEGQPRVEFDEAGVPTRYQDVVRDITARKTAEEEAARARAEALENESRYRLLAENATDMISRYCLDGTILYVSPASLDVIGFSPDELVGRRTLDLIHEDDLNRIRSQFAGYMASSPGASPIHTEHRVKRKDGRIIWLEGHPRLIRDEDGRPLEYQDVMRDVTARKAMEADLREARIAAEAAAQAKADFLANMSHELRTPLTSIIGYTSLAAERPELMPVTRDYVRRVQNASRALLGTVNDILDFSKLEASQVTIQPIPTDVLAICADAVELFTPQAAAKSLQLEIVAPSGHPPRLLIDPDRILQILLNLVSNAVKFTDVGAVIVEISHTANRLSLSVSDTGPGIPEDLHDRLFRRFSQIDGSSTRSHGGTGLGLAICKGLADRMGGSIAMQSTIGQGSCFTVELPAECAPASEALAPDVEAPLTLEALRVLVVDDNAANRDVARSIMKSAGAEVAEASDGSDALRRLAEQPFDAVLLDLRMPGLDGFEVLRLLRGVPGPNDHIPVVAYTANAPEYGERRLAFEGFDGLVQKPVQPAALLGAILSAINGEAAPETRLHAG